jgi:hypothetical protein
MAGILQACGDNSTLRHFRRQVAPAPRARAANTRPGAAADIGAVVDDILTGQYRAFNTAEGLARDVTEDVARKVAARAADQDQAYVDRLGRSLTDLLELLRELHSKGVDLPASAGARYLDAGGPDDVPDDGCFLQSLPEAIRLDAERLGGLEVDDQLKFGRCLHQKIETFFPLRKRST